MHTMTRILLAFLSFGLCAGIIFPFYANLFVHWKDGMLIYFVLGCLLAGVVVGVGNFLVFRKILKNIQGNIDQSARQALGHSIAKSDSSADLYQRVLMHFGSVVSELSQQRKRMEDSSQVLKRSIDQLSSQSGNMRSSMNSVNKESNQIVNVIHETRTLMQTTVNGFEKLKTTIGNAGDQVEQLSESSNKITGVLDIINNISFQTRLLANNAAIEAARAGESGAGFAVVADEVKMLSERSNKSTVEIQQIIDTMHRFLEHSRNAMSHCRTAIEEESNQLHKGMQSLSNMEGQTEQNHLRIDQNSREAEQLARLGAEILHHAQNLTHTGSYA